MIGSAVILSFACRHLVVLFTRREFLALSNTYERHLEAEAAQQEELKESRERFQITLKSLGEGVVSADQDGKISVHQPLRSSLRLELYRKPGRPFREVVKLGDERNRLESEDPVEAVRRAQAGSVSYPGRLGAHQPRRQKYPIELTGAPILNNLGQIAGISVVFRDTTQRRQTEQTLRTSERLTLAGRLSATIAHEIRNPLDTVTNLVYLLQHEQNANPASRQYLEMASEELTRIAQITSQLLTFHRESRSPVPVNLNEVLDSVLVLFSPQIKRNHIRVEKRFHAHRSVRGFPANCARFSRTSWAMQSKPSLWAANWCCTRVSRASPQTQPAKGFALRCWTTAAASQRCAQEFVCALLYDEG